jgi:hypothetical protein
MDLGADEQQQSDNSVELGENSAKDDKSPERDRKLAADIVNRIKADKKHHATAFKNMQRDMYVAMYGADKNWHADNYRANISGRHVKMKTASLYAKNPKAVAKRRETLDFTMWDESAESLQIAMQVVQQATMMVQQMASDPSALAAMPVDPMTGQPQLPPEVQMAQELLTDYKQGMQQRNTLAKFGKTMEILFSYALREQKPLDFKRGMKQVVRRTCTTGVGYVELGYQRETGPRPGMQERLADARTRLDHLRVLSEKAAEGDIDEFDKEMAELEHSTRQLMEEPEIVLREGLIVDYPQSTKVIPDSLCRSLDGFVGARHLTIEYSYTVDEVRELFGVDLSKSYTPYRVLDGSQELVVMDDESGYDRRDTRTELICVWKHYDKPTGLVYYVADGHKDFIRPPAAPDVFVEGFWPVYALTFNAVESEKELFPPSDVALLLPMQQEYNRCREGLRQHRKAAVPRWIAPIAGFEEKDMMGIKDIKPFEVYFTNTEPGIKVSDLMGAFPVPGVDPNLYETNQLLTDMQLVAGTQEAQLGGTSNSTATEASIAAQSTSASDSSSVDELDGFLSNIARDAGQILIREMDAQQVLRIAGRGATWPGLNMEIMSLEDLVSEVTLEVEAGSSGKPNQAVEINNWKQMLPFMLQLPGIKPTWIAKESIRRLDDKIDLVEAIAEGLPSITMMNQQKQVATNESDPNQQGAKGADNSPKPQEQPGSDPAMGSNREINGPIQQADGNMVAA